MRFLRFFCLLAMLSLTCAEYLHAQRYVSLRRGHHTSTDALQNAGLEKVWQNHVSVDSSRGRVIHITPHISRTSWLVEYEVVHEHGRMVFRENQLDRFGQPLSRERAAELADIEMRVLATRDVKAELVTHEIPKVTLFVQTDRAVLHALDGESGRTLWTAAIGRADYPSLSPGANDRYVAVVNGSTLYVLDTTEEKIVWERALAGAPGAGPVLTDKRIYVPLISGLIDGFDLDDVKIPVASMRAIGRTMVQPFATPKSIYWPTDRGYLYVADAETGESRFRLETRSQIVANAAYSDPGQIFAASADGYVYMINELTGEMRWRQSVGESIASAPVAIGDRVYVVSASHMLVCMAAETGADVWKTRGVRRFVAATNSHVYGVSDRGELLSIDPQTGAPQARIPLPGNDLSMANSLTDRIYVGSHRGALMCLRESQLERPLVHVTWSPKESEAAAESDAATAEDATETDAADAQPADEAANMFDDDVPFDDAPLPDEQPAEDTPAEDAGDWIDEGGDENPFEFGDEGDDENPFEFESDDGAGESLF